MLDFGKMVEEIVWINDHSILTQEVGGEVRELCDKLHDASIEHGGKEMVVGVLCNLFIAYLSLTED